MKSVATLEVFLLTIKIFFDGPNFSLNLDSLYKGVTF
jgi:hypothetical protein